jgi:hypothetical protein
MTSFLWFKNIRKAGPGKTYFVFHKPNIATHPRQNEQRMKDQVDPGAIFKGFIREAVITRIFSRRKKWQEFGNRCLAGF